MSKAKIVVRALEGSETITENHQEDLFRFSKGDTGILTWRFANGGSLTPLVIWDNDPKKKSWRVYFIQLEIIGLEHMGQRLLISGQAQ
jgi:hypothetical protein